MAEHRKDGTVVCSHGSVARYNRIESDYYGGTLQVDQSEPARHGCPICAYARGWEDALQAVTQNLIGGLKK